MVERRGIAVVGSNPTVTSFGEEIMTLLEQAKEQKWGPSVDEPKSEIEALEYAVSILGCRDRPCSLGEVYAIKGLLWLLERKKR